MKRYLLAIAFILLFSACKDTVPEPPKREYPLLAVGTVADNGSYTVANKDIIKQHWAQTAHNSIGNASIVSFEIVKSLTTNDKGQEFFMLTAKVSNNEALLSALLIKKGKSFYFEEEGTITACVSKCGTGCLPAGIYQNGRVRLYCTTCADCEKTEHPL